MVDIHGNAKRGNVADSLSQHRWHDTASRDRGMQRFLCEHLSSCQAPRTKLKGFSRALFLNSPADRTERVSMRLPATQVFPQIFPEALG
jgi:hypothetical protein